MTGNEVGHVSSNCGIIKKFLEVSAGRCIGGDYDMLALEGGRQGSECIVRGLVTHIMDVGWELIGSSENSNGIMGWTGVVPSMRLRGQRGRERG